jgi:diguanylate cyclase (GGDEF)-like protein/PAS domain S-box-containing protein
MTEVMSNGPQSSARGLGCSRSELERLCMRNLLQYSDERVFFKDLDSRFVLVSEGFVAALGGGRVLDEVIGLTDFDIFSAPHATEALGDEQRVIRTGAPMAPKLERETFADGPDRWVSTVKLPLRGDGGNIIGTWGISRDVTAQMAAEEALAYQSLHDALTGLPNRVLLIDRAERMLAQARRHGAPVGVLYIDIDGFKQVNDCFGHAAGDELLRGVAERLTGTIREADTVGRLGGDEFVVLLEGADSDDGPELASERIREVLAQPFELESLDGRAISVTASIGIAVGREESIDVLLRHADFALYEAKAAGRNRWIPFERGMHAAAQSRIALEVDLARAIAEEQFFLLYQPTFDLQSERITGVEALLRWRHPARGVLGPDTFIPLAEKSGSITTIGLWVLRTALRQAAEWRDRGRPVAVSVNVSARQLDDDRFVADVAEALTESAVDPALLTLEITETALMADVEAAARRLGELKSLGVCIAIDDFGTGYSSLSYLRQFPVDALKIDRSFIAGIAASRQGRALIHTLVQLGKTLGLATLAEGIEEDSQLRQLQAEHCDYGQGFLFSRPLDVPEIEALIASAPLEVPAAAATEAG